MITRIPKDAPLTVRFLTEPDRWFEYFEHFDTTTNKGFICIDGECPGCADDMRQTKRFLANAVDTDKSTVVAVQMPTSLVTILLKRYDRNGTLLDRNWELSKSGSGLDTEYDAESDGKTKFNFDLYEPLDLGDVLQSQIASDGGDDDEDEDTPPWEQDKPKGAGTSRRTAGLAKRNRTPPPDEDDEDDEEPEPPKTIRRGITRTNRTTTSKGRELAAGTRSLPRASASTKKTLGGTKKLGR